MATALSISKMTRLQKLKTMEDLWADLSFEDSKFQSPSWHAEVLSKTEAEIKAGKVKFTDWGQGKKTLRRQLG